MVKAPSGSEEPGSKVALATETANRQAGQFEESIPVNRPVFAVEQFAVGGEFVHQTEGRAGVGGDGAGDVKARPIGLAGEVQDNHRVVIELEMQMTDGNVA